MCETFKPHPSGLGEFAVEGIVGHGRQVGIRRDHADHSVLGVPGITRQKAVGIGEQCPVADRVQRVGQRLAGRVGDADLPACQIVGIVGDAGEVLHVGLLTGGIEGVGDAGGVEIEYPDRSVEGVEGVGTRPVARIGAKDGVADGVISKRREGSETILGGEHAAAQIVDVGRAAGCWRR